MAKLPQEKLEELCAMDAEELKHADFGWGPNAQFKAGYVFFVKKIVYIF